MKCNHDSWNSWIVSHPATGFYIKPHLDCLTCGEWLSLGPATITPEVEIEIRAAELAIQFEDGPFRGWDDLNLMGFAGRTCMAQPCTVCDRPSPGYLAGYLAAAILDGEG